MSPSRIRSDQLWVSCFWASRARLYGSRGRVVAPGIDWCAGTLHGFFAGALKRKRGLEVTLEKDEGGERVHRIR